MLAEAYHTKFFAGHEFSPNEAKYLSLLISNHSMMYAISTNGFSEVFELGHLEFTNHPNKEIKDNASFFLQNFSLHQKKFSKVNIAILNNDFSILPDAYHLDRELKSYLSFSGGKQEIKNAFSHQVKDFKFAFTVDPDLLSYLEKSFSNASIRHGGAVDLQLFFNHPSLHHSDLFLMIGDSMIEIMLKKNECLVFYNVYQYNTTEDVLYYLLFAMEQFGLNPLTTKLSIAAQLPVTSDLIKNISKYVKQVSFALVNTPVKTHKEIAKLPQHYYFTLLNQHLCEL